MDIADFANLPDLNKLITQEIKLKRQLAEETWIQCGAPNTNVWYFDLTDGEIVSVEEDGVEYDEEFSVVDSHANANSFYYDDLNQRLYIHTTDSDDPATLDGSDPKYSIVAFFWRGWGNRPVTHERMDQLLLNPQLDWWTTATNAEDVTEVIAGGSTVTRNTDVYDDNLQVYSAKIEIDAVPNSAGIYWSPSTKPQRKCKVKIRYKSPVGTGLLRIQDSGVNVFLNSSGLWQAGAADAITLANTATFVELEIEFVTHAGYSDYLIFAYSAVANAEVYIQRVDFWRYRLPMYYEPRLPKQLPTITQSVGTYVHPEAQISQGELAIINDGFFIDKKDIYLWHNCQIVTRIGELTTDYEDLVTCFLGIIRRPKFSAAFFRADTKDERLNLKKIPIDRLDSTTYPNCDPKWLNRPQLIALGSTLKFIPPCIDNTSYKYKATQATFGGVNYGIQAIGAVYKGGKTLATPADYAVDLVNGEFTLVKNPRDAEISCEIQALQVSQFGDAYAWNCSDWPYFLLVILNGIDKQQLNWSSFKDLYDNRNIPGSIVLMDEVDTLDVINQLQRTLWFHFFTRLDGTVEVRRYRSDVPTDALHLRNEDIKSWHVKLDTDQSYKELIIKKRKNLISKIYEDMSDSWAGAPFDPDKIEWEHGITSRLIIEVPLTSTIVTGTLWDNRMLMMEDPPEIITIHTINHGALLLNPTDKFKLTLTEEYDDGERTIYDDATFQVISTSKNLGTGETVITAFTGWTSAYWYVS